MPCWLGYAVYCHGVYGLRGSVRFSTQRLQKIRTTPVVHAVALAESRKQAALAPLLGGHTHIPVLCGSCRTSLPRERTIPDPLHHIASNRPLVARQLDSVLCPTACSGVHGAALLQGRGTAACSFSLCTHGNRFALQSTRVRNASHDTLLSV